MNGILVYMIVIIIINALSGLIRAPAAYGMRKKIHLQI